MRGGSPRLAACEEPSAGFVAAPEDLERELNSDQRTTLGQMRACHDLVEVDRYLPQCGTAWVVVTNYDSGGREITHHVIAKNGVSI
jgi:hypothetical protein